MKNSKITKILIFTLTAALLVCLAFAFSVSAEETEAVDPDLAVAGKNIVYSDTFAIQYAISTSKISSAAELVVADSTGVRGSAKYTKTLTTDKITGAEDTYYVFEVTGIPASDVCEEITVYVKDGEKVGPELKYSLGEYFYERLYADDIVNATEGKALYQKELYLNYLDYAASAQNLFKNFEQSLGVTLVTDRYYAYVEDGTLDGSNDSAMFDPNNEDASVTLAYTGTAADFNGWTVTTYTAEGTETETVAANATVALTGHTVITPYLKVVDNSTVTEGETYSDFTLPSTGNYGGTYLVGVKTLLSGDQVAVVDDPMDSTNKVLKIVDNTTSSASAVRVGTSKVGQGKSVFETKLYIDESYTDQGTDEYIGQWGFYKGGSSVQLFNIKYESTGDVISISCASTIVNEAIDGSNVVKLPVDTFKNRWVSIRFEYYNSTDASKIKTLVYVNNELVLTCNRYKNTDDANNFVVNNYSSGLGTIYLDNTSWVESSLPTE